MKRLEEGSECPRPIITMVKHVNNRSSLCLWCPPYWVNSQLSETSIVFLTFLRAYKELQALGAMQPFFFIWDIDPQSFANISLHVRCFISVFLWGPSIAGPMSCLSARRFSLKTLSRQRWQCFRRRSPAMKTRNIRCCGKEWQRQRKTEVRPN